MTDKEIEQLNKTGDFYDKINEQNSNQDKLIDLMEGNVDIEETPEITEISLEKMYAKIMESDHNALNELMLSTLGQELKENESQKRSLKQSLMKYIQGILIFQLGLIGLAFFCVCISICFCEDSSILSSNLNEILDFLQYYITAIIVELIAMLFFIVKFVFDKSIVELLSDTIHKDNKIHNKKTSD